MVRLALKLFEAAKKAALNPDEEDIDLDALASERVGDIDKLK